jgi:cyclopropane fatty-acyl-phospholipid synthase-like methyltransferase
MATDPVFEYDGVFDEDYLYFYEESLTAEGNAADVDAVWKLLTLQPGESVLELGCGHGRIANALAEKGARMTGLGSRWPLPRESSQRCGQAGC